MLNNSTHCLTTGFTKACENNTRFVGGGIHRYYINFLIRDTYITIMVY